MFEKISMTGTGASIVLLLQVFFPLFGIEFSPVEIESLVAAGFTLVGSVLLIVGQLRRKDLFLGLFRK